MVNFHLLFLVVILLCFVITLLNGEALQFKLAASNLPNKDLDGWSDPYVKLFTTSAIGGRQQGWMRFGETNVVMESANPSWDQTFVYNYINGTNQRWRFMVKDWDEGWFFIDNHLGKVELSVDDYVGQIRVVNGTRTSEPIQVFLTQPMGGILSIIPQY